MCFYIFFHICEKLFRKYITIVQIVREDEEEIKEDKLGHVKDNYVTEDTEFGFPVTLNLYLPATIL